MKDFWIIIIAMYGISIITPIFNLWVLKKIKREKWKKQVSFWFGMLPFVAIIHFVTSLYYGFGPFGEQNNIKSTIDLSVLILMQIGVLCGFVYMVGSFLVRGKEEN